MRALLATVLALTACAEAPPPVDDPVVDGGKEDAAGAKLCDSLPTASKGLCNQIPNNG